VDPLVGNPDFNLTGVTPSNTLGDVAVGAITDEDMALDRELDRMANEMPPPDIDPEPQGVGMAKRETEEYTLLSELMDVKPASTVNELLEQVHLAKESGADSVEATPALVRHYCRRQYPDKVGYFLFHDIKVYIEGFFEQSIKRDKETVEERAFGKSKVSIQNTRELKR
jgi:hypothetical protein